MKRSIRNYKIALLLVLILGLTNSGFSQEKITLTGNIKDIATNEALADINVSVEGESGYFTTSDENGNFSFEIPSTNVSVLFSYPRFKNLSIYVGEKNNLNIKLVPEDYKSDLDYVKLPSGEQQKRFASQSAEMLTEDVFRQRPHASAEHYLYGKVSGLNVTAINGAPGVGASLVMRGLNSMETTNQPLYIVDGIDVSQTTSNIISEGSHNSPLIYLSPEDIESITVLKDAAAKGIYGARSANGVILINTYAGEKGKSKMDFTFSTGLSEMETPSPLLGSELNRLFLADMLQSKIAQGGFDEANYTAVINNDTSSLNYQKYNNSTDWLNLVKDKGKFQNYHFRLWGGDDVSKYSFSVGFWNQDGILLNTNMNRLNARFNLDYKISDKFRYGNNISFTILRQDRQFMSDSEFSPMFTAFKKSPFTAPYVQDNEGVDKPVLENYDVFGVSNPVALSSTVINKNSGTTVTGRIFAEYSILKELTVYTEFSLNQITQQEKVFIPGLGVVPQKDIERSSAQTYNNNLYLTGKLEGRYNKIFDVKHHLSAVAGIEFRNNQLKNRFGRSYNPASDDFTSLGQGAFFDTLSSGTNDWRNIGFYAAGNYGYKQKYLATATVRVDGHSRFGANNRFIPFPVAGVAWRIDQEDFLVASSWIDILKLRASFGYTGNDDVGNYRSQLLYVPANYKNLGGISLGQLINEDLKPEITQELNVGVDWAIFNQKLNVSIDGYNNVNTNLLINQNVPLETGFSYITINGGKVLNQGIETSISWQMRNGDLHWDLGANMAYNKNKVLELPENTALVATNYNGFVGTATKDQPLGSLYGYETDGVFRTNEEASQLINGDGYTYEPFQGGDIKFVDKNNDGIINEKDKTFLGKASPDIYGGIWAGAQYKGVSLRALVDIQNGRQVVNGMRYYLESMSGFTNQSMTTDKRWRAEGDDAEMPRLAHNDPAGNNRFSDRWVEDGSFIRLRSVRLSYNLPGNILNRIYLKKLQIYVSAENLVTLTKYEGIDPEFNHLANDMLSGVDLMSAPLYRTYSFGIQIGL